MSTMFGTRITIYLSLYAYPAACKPSRIPCHTSSYTKGLSCCAAVLPPPASAPTMPPTSRTIIHTCPVSARALLNNSVCPSCQGCQRPSICVVGFCQSNAITFFLLLNYPYILHSQHQTLHELVQWVQQNLLQQSCLP